MTTQLLVFFFLDKVLMNMDVVDREISEKVCRLPIGVDGVVSHYLELSWGLLDIIFGYCDLVTMCSLRRVCRGFQEAVDDVFSDYSSRNQINMKSVVKEMDDLIESFGRISLSSLSYGNLIDLTSNDEHICNSRKCCKKLQLRKQLGKRRLDQAMQYLQSAVNGVNK